MSTCSGAAARRSPCRRRTRRLRRWRRAPADPPELPAPLSIRVNPRYSVDEKPNTYEQITHYNNFYEFGTDKTDPARHARARCRRTPGASRSPGEAEKTGTFTLEDILRPHPLEERIYRFRCVEAWSMVIPWLGFPLGDLLKRFNPTSRAKYVEFTTLVDPADARPARPDSLPWPYVEGLRIDEAMHPLALDRGRALRAALPNQNGAPLRTMAPWKYGFKSGKSIVRIRFTRAQPRNTWNVAAPSEYGFYANVNPERRPPALEPGDRAAHRQRLLCHAAADADVQRLCRRGRVACTRAWTCVATSSLARSIAATAAAARRPARP